MAGTQVVSTRQVIQDDGVNKYQISTNCIIAGTLPDISIFVLSVDTAGDPKDDALVRVVEIGDFAAITTSRDDSIDDGSFVYRSPSVNIAYDDIETANAGQNELSARINTLVNNHDDVETEFLTGPNGETLTYPTADNSLKTTYETAYNNATEVVASAETTRDNTAAECASAEAEVNRIQALLAQTSQDILVVTDPSATLQAQLPVVDATRGQIASLVNNLQVQISASDATATQQTAMLTLITQIESQILTQNNTSLPLSNASSAIAGFVDTLNTREANLTTDKNSAETELNNCNAELSSDQAAVVTAQTEQQAALNLLLAVCPDFTP